MGVSSDMLPARIDLLKATMGREGIHAMVIFKPENSFDLTNFNTVIYSHPVIAIVVPSRDPIMLVYALRYEHGIESAFVPDVRLFGKWSGRQTLGATWQIALASILEGLSLPGSVVGVEKGFVSAERFDEIQAALPWASLVNVSPMLRLSREIKDNDQIANARLAGKIADVGMAQVLKSLAQGASERQASIMSMHAMNLHWDEDDAFADVEVCGFGSLEGGLHNGLATWILSGPRKFLNCDNPKKRVPQAGETVSVFIWTVVNGMHSEIERTVCIGEVSAADQKALKAIHEIRAEVLALFRPGTRVKDLYETAVRGFTTRGYGDNLPGRIGHGIGLGPHEEFSVNAASEAVVLKPGMIITLEPHIQVINDGVGEVATQFSDTILITDTGYEFLTTPSKPEHLVIHR